MYFDYFVINMKTTFGEYNYIALMFTPSRADNGAEAYIKIYDIEREYDTIFFKNFCNEYRDDIQLHKPVNGMLKDYTEESGELKINNFLYLENEVVSINNMAVNRIEMTISEFIQNALKYVT